MRAKDVALLFADAATGAHSPALVSQGRIGAVIAAKPAERRLMLEEAAGIAGLHARRKDAEQKLRATEANLARLDELLGDQEKRAATLRRQARAAERYRQLTDKIRAVEARLVYARWLRGRAAAEEARREAAAAAAEVEQLQQQAERARARRRRPKPQLAERREAASARRATRAATLAHQLATARAGATPSPGGCRARAAGGDDAAEIAREQALKADAARRSQQLDEERSAIEQRLADSEGRAARLAAELGELEAAVARSRGGACRPARAAGGDARRAAGRRSRARGRAGPARRGSKRERARLDEQLGALGDGEAEHGDGARRGDRPRFKRRRKRWPRPRRGSRRPRRAATAARRARDEAESALASAPRRAFGRPRPSSRRWRARFRAAAARRWPR